MAQTSDLGALGTTEGLALTLAVIYHGFSCLADKAVPARVDTIMHTAESFERHLLDRQAIE